MRTDWDIIMDKFNFNFSAIAKVIVDHQNPPPKRGIGHIRVDLEHLRFNQYTASVPFLLQLHNDKAIQYQKENPSLISAVDIGIAVQQTIKALEPVTDKEEVLALIRADEQIERLVQLVYNKLGGGVAWSKILKGVCDEHQK